MTLRFKVLFAISTACVALTLAVAVICVIQVNAARTATATVDLRRLLSAVVHEMQIERGRSVGAISSGYAERNVGAMEQQRLGVVALSEALE